MTETVVETIFDLQLVIVFNMVFVPISIH